MQIGHPKGFWPIAILKELIDNSLEACETAGALPDIEITVDSERFRLKTMTLAFLKRPSSRHLII